MAHAVVYTGMHTDARDVVERYYAAFDAHQNEWQDLVTDDVVFEGPVQHARGKAEFLKLTAQFLNAHRATRLLRRIADGNTVTSMFEFACGPSMYDTYTRWLGPTTTCASICVPETGQRGMMYGCHVVPPSVERWKYIYDDVCFVLQVAPDESVCVAAPMCGHAT